MRMLKVKNMTRFGVQRHNAHLLKNAAQNQTESDTIVDEDLDLISVKPVVLRKPNPLKPMKMLHEVQQEAVKLYDIDRLERKFDYPMKPSFTDSLTRSASEPMHIPNLVADLSETKMLINMRYSNDDGFEKLKATRDHCKSKLTELVQRIDGIPLTLDKIHKNKVKMKLLYDTFMKCRHVIVLDITQLEFALSLLPVEVNEWIGQLLGNFYERTKQQLDQCNEVNVANLKRLYQVRAYLHQVFECVFMMIGAISKECTALTVPPDNVVCSNATKDTQHPIIKIAPIIVDNKAGDSPCLNKSEPVDPISNSDDASKTEGNIKVEQHNNNQVEEERKLDLNTLLYPKLMDYNFSYQFNRDVLKQMLQGLTDDESKQQFIKENGGKSRQILNKEIIVEINRLGGFDLHLKTIQPILKRLFPRPEELDPESRSLNLVKNWGAFQYYCENLIDAVKKLFYTPIPERDIVTPVLSHYVASLAICNPYFRIYVQHFIVDISDFHLFELAANDPKTVEIDTMKLDRLDNIYHFMAYLYLTPSGVGLSEKIQLTCFGLRNAWYVLATVANSKSPYVELKIVVVFRFLQICGFAMMVFYQNQFVKLLNFIIANCMPEWKRNLPDCAHPFYIRLHDLINNACMTGLLNRPKYLNKKIFPYLNRTNIPKFNDRELFCIRNFRLLYD